VLRHTEPASTSATPTALRASSELSSRFALLNHRNP
jgi:hypothetical protein